jgi:hypothetical protein
MAQPNMTHRHAFVLYGKRDTRFVIQEAKEPEPGDLDVVVSPQKTGICGSVSDTPSLIVPVRIELEAYSFAPGCPHVCK